MLKISCKNENLKRCLKHKGTPRLLHPIFRCFFKQKNNIFFQKKDLGAQFRSYLLHSNRQVLFKTPFSKTRTICFLTGRSRSVYRAFHLSRLKLREFAAAGYFSGLSKAS